MTQAEVLQIIKTDPGRWWYSKEISKKMKGSSRRCNVSLSQLLKFGFIEKKHENRFPEYKLKDHCNE